MWFELSVREGSHGGPVLFDQHAERPISDIFHLIDARVEAVSITFAPTIEPAIAEIRSHWSGPMAVYPDGGHFEMPSWNFNDVMEPPSSLTTPTGGEILAASQLVAAVVLARVTSSCCRLARRPGNDVVAVG